MRGTIRIHSNYSLCFYKGLPLSLIKMFSFYMFETFHNIITFFLKKHTSSYLGFFVFFVFVFWLCWIFVAMCGLSLVAASGGYSLLRYVGFSLRWLLMLWSTGSRCAGFSSCGSGLSSYGSQALGAQASVVVAHGLSCSVACGIFPDQESNPRPLHWQADS